MWSDILIQVLQIVVPVGGIGSAIAWLSTRDKRRHDAYKSMYEDLNLTAKELTNERKELNRTVGRLERAIQKMFSCRHYPNCPVSIELLRNKTTDTKPKNNRRQRTGKGGQDGNIRDGPAIEGTSDNPNDEP